MESHSDTGNMVHESKMPEPVAWLVCGGRTFVDRGFTSEDGARESVVKRNDGARIEPLYTAAALDLAKQEATRQAMQLAENACARIESSEWEQYKGRAANQVAEKAANPYIAGKSDGASDCIDAIRALLPPTSPTSEESGNG